MHLISNSLSGHAPTGVDALTERKFGPGGPFNPETPGYYKDSKRVRSSAHPHNEEFRECVALQAQHLDPGFYDHFYEKGAYLDTHARHIERWQPER